MFKSIFLLSVTENDFEGVCIISVFQSERVFFAIAAILSGRTKSIPIPVISKKVLAKICPNLSESVEILQHQKLVPGENFFPRCP